MIDAVGVSESLKTISQPLERNRAISFDRVRARALFGARLPKLLDELTGTLVG